MENRVLYGSVKQIIESTVIPQSYEAASQLFVGFNNPHIFWEQVLPHFWLGWFYGWSSWPQKLQKMDID